MLPTRSSSPQNRAEDQNRQQEKNAGNLEPDFAANATERLEEATQSASHAARGLSCDATTVCGTGRRCARLGAGRRSRIGLLAFAHDGLASETARHSNSNTKHPADGFRSHFDMMVAAPDLRGDLFESNPGAICRMAVREVRYRNQSPLPAQLVRAGRRRR